jgi:hypothetical protein
MSLTHILSPHWEREGVGWLCEALVDEDIC